MVDTIAGSKGINQNAAHKKNGTHPGKGWFWTTNTSEPKKYRRRLEYTVVSTAFNGDGTVWKAGSAVFAKE
jgi:hypothetical protein